MNEEISLIIVVSLIIFISPFISRVTKIPTVPIEIILGSVAISTHIITHNHIFELIAEVGFLYLMFLAGLEVDLKKILRVSTEIIKKSLFYIILLYLLSSIFVLYLNLEKIYIVTIPLISIGLLAALKKEYGETKWLNMAITAGLIGEIISIIVLTVVSAWTEFGNGIELYEALFILLLVFISMIAIYKFFHNLMWWYPEIRTMLMPKDDHLESDIRVSMAIFFLMTAVMLYLNLEVALGTFIAGTFIATFFEHNKELPHKLEHFGFGWLVPIFFIWIGTSFDYSSLYLNNLVLTAGLITAAMILFRVVSSLIFHNELGIKDSILMGLSHSMPLTLLIAVVTLAYNNLSIDQFHYHAFILAAILEVIISMVVIRLIVKRERD